MASNQIVNAAPMVIDRGTQDLSRRQVPREPIAVPQHLPKMYLYAQKGPTTPVLASGAELTNVYGSETFNLQGKFATANTVFAQGAQANANALMVQRLIPEDAGPNATLCAWLDVLPTTVDVYQRNSDGSIATDGAGDAIITGTTAGYKVKWVVTHYPDAVAAEQFGQLTQTAGDQVDAATSTQSTRYPIFELKASSVGSYGNFSGIRLWAPTIRDGAMPTKMMNTAKAYPYMLQMIQRPDALSSPKVVPTVFAEQEVMFTFKPEVVDPVTAQRLYAGEIVVPSYENLSDPKYPKVYGNFHDHVWYDDNIAALTAMFHAAEIPFINGFSDITADPADKHLFNFVTGVSSFNVPYHSFVFTDSPNTTRWAKSTNVYAAGSSDGTMNETAFALLVKNAVSDYLDPLNPVQELAVNPESIIYDSGFPLETKYELLDFISQRKDTFVVLSTYTNGEPPMDAAEDMSVSIALRTRAQMFPESDYFGTPVMRCMIVGRSGKIRNSLWKKELPLTYEVLVKAAKYMGAGNGRWVNGQNFDGAPGSIVESMTDVSITWVPASVRNRNWDVGLNWVQAYDVDGSYFFPAFKTVYNDDTSVLNSFTLAMAICYLNKVAHACWREYSGKDSLTNAQLIQRVNDFVNDRVNNKFDGRYVIKPDAQVTDMDVLRGFSWTLPIKIYAPNMKTVMTTYVQAYRIEDLAAA
jgi:hypothetical protein